MGWIFKDRSNNEWWGGKKATTMIFLTPKNSYLNICFYNYYKEHKILVTVLNKISLP